MKKKMTVAVVCGGRSSEHQVSLVSGLNIFKAIDRKKYKVVAIGIDEKGDWQLAEKNKLWEKFENIKNIKLSRKAKRVFPVKNKNGISLLEFSTAKLREKIDVFFPITHGTYGEDGCLQGFFETLDVAYVGPSVLGSSLGMDKDVAKNILRQNGIAVTPSITLRKMEKNISVDKIISQIGLPLFAKPSSLGSSVGVFKCETKKELAFAIKEIFDIDKKILIEQAVVGREIECSVLGLEKPIASLPGEIQLQSGFYSYDAKYISDSLAVPISKAALSAKTIKEVQKLAIKTFQALECEIMTRVDFFLKEDGELIVNEINTLPGFTSISMYPKMLENTGIKYIDLLSELISLAIERKNKQ